MVKTGNHTVSMALLALAVMTTDAGRDSENGTGAMWVAPELVASSPALVETCSQRTGQRPDLVFEILEPDNIEAELPRLLAMSAREVVDFEWHSATGELTFRTTAPTAVFSDLEFPAGRASAHQAAWCESR